jgi:hypothetical protein
VVYIKIEFENGSVIESLETDGSNIRSKRAEEQIKYYRENLYELIKMYMGVIFDKLNLWQKLYIKALCKWKH